jgi:hypothetical protein
MRASRARCIRVYTGWALIDQRDECPDAGFEHERAPRRIGAVDFPGERVPQPRMDLRMDIARFLNLLGAVIPRADAEQRDDAGLVLPQQVDTIEGDVHARGARCLECCDGTHSRFLHGV